MMSRRAGWADFVVPVVAVAALAVTTVHGCRRKARALPTETPADAGAPSTGRVASDPDAADEADELPKGSLAFEVLDADKKTPIACKLTFVGTQGTPTPRLSAGEIPFGVDGGLASYSRVFSLGGRGSLRLPSGRYDITVSRGPEWSTHVERAVYVGLEGTKLSVSLRHQVPTPGWISADLHVHAAPSWDSTVPVEARVHEFTAEGVDVLVASDHNVITDYTPAINELGAERSVATLVGVELSTVDWGHFGAFPMAPDNDWWVLRGVRMKGLAPIDLLRSTRRRDPAALITVNHPRLGSMGYFNRAAFDPIHARVTKGRSSLDFDAVEVMNGYKDAQPAQIARVLTDWFSLIRHGRRVTAVGNSDTHHLRYSVAGYPRNYVLVRDDAVGATSGEQLAEALRHGESYFTTGPILDVRVDGKELGGVVPAKGKRPKLRVVVRAASWISVSRVTVLVDGKPEHEWSVSPSEKTERFVGTYELSPKRDAFVVVRVDGDRPLAPVVGGGGLKPIPVFALTNPIWLDVDGNGKYDAPL